MSGAEIAIATATGLLAGAFAGAMGVGGGVIMVPVLVELLDQTQHTAQGTSLAVIVATAIIGTVASHRAGLLDRRIAAFAAIGGMVGAIGGSLLALEVVGEDALRRAFGVAVILVAVRTAGSALWPRRGAGGAVTEP